MGVNHVEPMKWNLAFLTPFQHPHHTMKKGFLKNPRQKAQEEPGAHRSEFSTNIVSQDPSIICSDPALAKYDVAHILCIPRKEPQIVIIDTLARCREMAKWEVWQGYGGGAPKANASSLFAVEEIHGKGRGMVLEHRSRPEPWL